MARGLSKPRYEGDFVIVERLKLASWLYVNNQRLVRRELDSRRQHITYYFELSPQTDALIEQWSTKKGVVDLVTLARFSQSVSYEIKLSMRLRRGDDFLNPRVEPRRDREGLRSSVEASG